MSVYPGDLQPEFTTHLTIEKEGANVTRIALGSHTGTHVDAPWHFLQDGNTIDKEHLDKFVGQASHCRSVVQAGGRRHWWQDLDEYARAVKDNDILLIYTGTDKARSNFTYIETSAAEWLVHRGVKCVGIDTLSVENMAVSCLKAGLISPASGQALDNQIFHRVRSVGSHQLCSPADAQGG